MKAPHRVKYNSTLKQRNPICKIDGCRNEKVDLWINDTLLARGFGPQNGKEVSEVRENKGQNFCLENSRHLSSFMVSNFWIKEYLALPVKMSYWKVLIFPTM